MVFPIVGGDGKPTGYEIENSVRFNDGDSAKLSRTFDSGGSRRKYTFSAWVKRGVLGQGYGDLFGSNLDSGESAGSKSLSIGFTSSNTFTIDSDTGAALSLSTTRAFRDPSAWYHFVVAVDTTQGTASNRVKLYVNGVQETLTGNFPAQDLDTGIGRASEHTIGADYNSFFDGYMAEIYFVNNQQYDQTYFGETNSDGIWVPVEKDKGAGGAITFGTNGFYMQFQQTGTSQNSSGIGADTSGEDHHFAVTNLAATDVTEDTPTNNFATLNSADAQSLGNATLSEGNLKFDGADGDTCRGRSTIMVANGKWYAEFRVANNHKLRISVTDNIGMETNGPITNDGVDFGINDGYLYTYLNGTNNDTGAGSSSSAINLSYTHSSNDIIGVALDADNNTVRFYVNGSAQGSEATVLQRATDNVFYMFSVYDFSGSGNNANTVECNFGNPSFSISSGNNDGKYGNFEYAPPSGFYALCTKRLAEFG